MHALTLRVQGLGWSEVAQLAKYSDGRAAMRGAQHAAAREQAGKVSAYRKFESTRCDLVIRKLWHQAFPKSGGVVLPYCDAILKWAKHKCNLLGIAMPQKAEQPQSFFQFVIGGMPNGQPRAEIIDAQAHAKALPAPSSVPPWSGCESDDPNTHDAPNDSAESALPQALKPALLGLPESARPGDAHKNLDASDAQNLGSGAAEACGAIVGVESAGTGDVAADQVPVENSGEAPDGQRVEALVPPGRRRRGRKSKK